MIKPIHIVGGGMAGSEAAWQIVSAGIPVIIHEMRPSVETFAHQTHDLAELVCSNSFRSDDDEIKCCWITSLGNAICKFYYYGNG